MRLTSPRSMVDIPARVAPTARGVDGAGPTAPRGGAPADGESRPGAGASLCVLYIAARAARRPLPHICAKRFPAKDPPSLLNRTESIVIIVPEVGVEWRHFHEPPV
jgi:hypothetical protein